MNEQISVSVGGGNFPRWKEITIEACVKNAARSFSLEGTLEIGGAEAGQFMPPAMVTISATGELLFTGYVDKYKPELNAKEIKFTASGRSKGADAVDCSCDHTKGDYVKKTLLQIAQDQDAFGIGFSSDIQMEPIDRTRPNVGESLFDYIRGHLGDNQATMSGQADGGIKITQAGVNAPRQPGPIIEGLNYFKGSAEHDWSKRHSEVNVHGQAAKGTGSAATQIKATATDGSVTRRRPLHLVHNGHTDKGRLTKRATNHRNAEAGEGTRLTYEASTWRDATGALWTPGNKVWVEVPSLNVVQDMLIEKASYKSHYQTGEYASLDLVDPRAHGGSGGGVNKSGGGWSTSTDAAS